MRWSGIVFYICFWPLSCGADPENEPESATDQEKTGAVVAAPGGASKPNLSVAISVGATDAIGNGLGLATTGSAATAYTIDLSDCLSGYTATVSETDAELEVYKSDRDCLAKLSQFTFDGRTYLPTSGDPLTTWQAGDTAIFDEAGEPGTAPLAVAVIATLDNPISGTETIQYNFSELLEGADRSILGAIIGADAQDDQGQTPPNFSVKSVTLTSLASGTEAGQFELVMECNVSIGITSVCDTVDFTDMDYKLVEDTYGGSPSTAQLDTVFATAGTSIQPGDRVAPGDQGTTNGGFETATLDGPDDMATNPNMLFVIRSYGTSYQYFNVDIVVGPTY